MKIFVLDLLKCELIKWIPNGVPKQNFQSQRLYRDRFTIPKINQSTKILKIDNITLSRKETKNTIHLFYLHHLHITEFLKSSLS